MDIELMDDTELQAMIERLPTMTVERKVALYIRLREGKSAITKHLDAVKAQYDQLMSAVENRLLAEADSQQVTGFTIAGVGTTYTSEICKFSIADDAALFKFIIESGDLGYFERRLSSTYIQEYMKNNNGQLPPGVNLFRERAMRVRKS